MSVSFYLKLYLLTFPVFFLVDMLWLGVIARKFYRRNLHQFLADEVNWVAAFAFYFMYIVGILFFATIPALQSGTLQKAAFLGAAFGFFTYATYDLTNMATLNKWPLNVVVVDILWGTVLCAVVASGSYLIGRWLLS